jgi:hypothetical protein
MAAEFDSYNHAGIYNIRKSSQITANAKFESLLVGRGF